MFICLLLLSHIILGRADSTRKPPSDSAAVSPWKYTLMTGLNVDQIAFSNWAAGGESSVAASFMLNSSLLFRSESWEMDDVLRIAYGRTKTGGHPSAVTENQLYLATVYTLLLGWATNPFVSYELTTQTAAGYDYSQSPPVQSSDFLDPAYMNQTAGLAYTLRSVLSTRFGLGLQEVIVRRFQNFLHKPFGVNSSGLEIQTGIQSVTTLCAGCGKNMTFRSDLHLFSAFDHLRVWDVTWNNSLTGRVNNIVRVDLDVMTIYQKEISPRTQMKEGIQLGVVYRFF